MSEDVIATCNEMDAEIVRVLTEKFSWEQNRAISALQAILARGIWRYIPALLRRIPTSDSLLSYFPISRIPDICRAS